MCAKKLLDMYVLIFKVKNCILKNYNYNALHTVHLITQLKCHQLIQTNDNRLAVLVTSRLDILRALVRVLMCYGALEIVSVIIISISFQSCSLSLVLILDL